jgi:coenzyme PQQ precursor peptide PqqA
MTWTTPEIEEVTCGMEINMYFPAEDDGDLF